MNTYKIYISSVWSCLQKLFKSSGEGFLLTGKMLLLLLVFGLSDVQAQGIDQITGQVKPIYNYKLYEAVQVQNFFDQRELKKYAKSNFEKYPMGRYKVDFTKINRIQVGDRLSDELLDLPLWVTNDDFGRDTLTLRSEMDEEWLILDFWTEWCGPCVKSMNKWEKRVDEEEFSLNLLGIYTDLYPHKAMVEARKKGYKSIQVIGPSMAILKALFLGEKTYLGPSVWIKDGRLFGVSDAEKMSEAEYKGILSGDIKEIPAHAVYKGRL
ncbi:TlpA family protein disulfide reductase [Sphingobacterium faecium]|uniref:TlpA family protein disulfide reductase n=1 Tax=Sphingobacterium faecium TaxID=34087 RepID=UPI00246981E3|nr:hypothetical protein [Sphingobacterium faecium]MDH5828721.1 hypothetical protein [Sphingobacterium faecium]